jgi:hypothetical protein
MRKQSLSLTSRENQASIRTARKGSRLENQAPGMKTATIPRENQTPTDRKTGMMAKAPAMSQMAARTRITRKAETVQDRAMMVEVVPDQAVTVEVAMEGAEATSSFKNPREIRGDFLFFRLCHRLRRQV